MFDPFGRRSLLVGHLLGYGMVLEVSDMNAFLYSLSMYVLRFLTIPLCWLDAGGIEGQNDVWWPIRWKGVSSMCGACTPHAPI